MYARSLMINRFFSPEEMQAQKDCAASVRKIVTDRDIYSRPLRAHVMTLGCQQNEADSEKLEGMALEMGYTLTDTPEKADLILVNTCAIREHAEQRALSFIGNFKKLKAANPYLVVGVCGCMVSQEHRINDIKHKYPYVDFVFGTASLHRFPSLLYEALKKKKRVFFHSGEEDYLVAEGLPIHRNGKTHTWVSIMYGCNNFCSYCIVPYVRGRERSRRREDIVAEVRELVANGYKDITLLGQNVNSYGKDGQYGYDFADLLEELAQIDGDFYLRFMTSHPKDVTDKLIKVVTLYPKIAPHFHLPLQSGSDRVLRTMNRHYDMAKYLSTVEKLRALNPDITLTSDIIVGFPGETQEEFEETISALENIRFDMIYSFIYSARKGTPAAEMEDQIPREEQNRRYSRLLAVQQDISLAKNTPLVGRTERVLCDGISKNDPTVYCGRTPGNKIVFFAGDESMTDSFVNVKIDRAEAFALFGTVVKN